MTQSSDQDPCLLAAEYVLGTLSVDDAASVEQRLEHNTLLRDEVVFWEQKLGTLGLVLEPLDPPPTAWDAIFQGLQDGVAAKAKNDVTPQDTTGARLSWLKNSIRAWQGLTAVATVIAVALAIVLFMAQSPTKQLAAPTYASMFFDASTSTGWLLTVSTSADRVTVTTVGDYPLAAGKELRLWVIPPGGKPQASGVVPAHGNNSWALSAQVATLLQQPGTALAISVETVGAALSAGPQGPVKWQALLHRQG